mgnify:CR=1 FL=1
MIPALGMLLAPVCFAETDDPHRHHRAMAESSAQDRSIARYDIPDLTMVDQNGRDVVVTDLFDTDRPVMVNFIFTTCTTICPMMASIFQQVQVGLADDAEDVLMVSVSIDPEQDTATELAEYAGRFRAGPQWHFLTGTLDDSIALQQAFEAYRGDKMNHAPMTLLRGRADSNWVRFDGFASARELEREVRSELQKNMEDHS